MPKSPVPLDEQLCYSLYSASLAVNRLYKPMLDRLGITYPQYLVLSTLCEAGDHTVSSIAERLGLESSTVTPLLKRLEGAGLLTRARSAKDERQVCVALTAKGMALHGEARCLNEALLPGSGLSLTEMADLNQRVVKLRTALDESRQARRP